MCRTFFHIVADYPKKEFRPLISKKNPDSHEQGKILTKNIMNVKNSARLSRAGRMK